MQEQRRPWLSSLTVIVAAFAAAQTASAASLGAVAAGAVLGQPLDLSVPLRLEAGESIAPECISAEVTVGERRLTPGQVRLALDTVSAELARVRVVTLQGVDEPMVSVQVSAGCGSQHTRRYTLLVDPPMHVAAAPVVPVAVAVPAVSAAAEMAPPSDGLTRSVAPAPALAAVEAAPVAPQNDAPRRAVLRAVPRARAANNPQRAERRATATASARQARPVRMRAAAPAADPTPRLKLDAPEATGSANTAPSAEALAVEQALQVVAQAASAARDAAAAASASQARIAALEREVGSLRIEAKTQRDTATQLRERLMQTRDSGNWTWTLIGVSLLLLLAAIWLGGRMLALQRERARGWGAAANAPHTATGGASTQHAGGSTAASELDRPFTEPPRGKDSDWQLSTGADAFSTQPMAIKPAAVAPVSVYPPTHAPTITLDRTEVLPVPGPVDDQAPRDVSIEELIDLEQQAEFFVVLGQDEAAIDLLVEHLRHTGGGSPLPYLKLLEIYRRRGDRASYERTRDRFNQRFNAYAPDWNIELNSGRTLEDYSGVLPRLQQVWARPLDAMAELEALLFRKSRGELFDLPAYREVLFLYALARDLLDREAADTGNVDLLLPLSDMSGGDFGNTTPGAFLGLENSAERVPDDRPTQPVDLDLTADQDRPSSIFDPIAEEDARRPRRR